MPQTKFHRQTLNIGHLLILATLACCTGKQDQNVVTLNNAAADVRPIVDDFVSSMRFDSLQGLSPEVTVNKVDDGIVRVDFKYRIDKDLRQDDWKVTITPKFLPTFHYAPHLTPTKENIIAQHVFRSPALIAADSSRQVVIIPDLDLIGKDTGVKWYMDLDAPANKLIIGVSRSKVTQHVLFARDTGMVLRGPEFRFGFYLMTSKERSDLDDPWRKPLAFLWNKWGKALYERGEPIKGDLEPYVKRTYDWAFDTWKKSVWQEFTLNGIKVGAPVFIVNVTQSPNYPGDVNEREFRSIWNQAWFSSLRSASGLYRYAKRTHNKDLLAKANMTKELALAFPQKDGLFPAVIGTEMEKVEMNGKTVSRSKGWSHYYFGNSNRNPVKDWGEASVAPYHILDMSWTAYLMLVWNNELEKDQRLIDYAKRYAEKLVSLQSPDGFFPAWLDKNTLQPTGYLDRSPETSMSVTFLLAMFEQSGELKYKDAALRAMKAVVREIVPYSQWEDYETYWSCSRVLDSMVGKKIIRNDAFKQNTLSMYWTAEALYNSYRTTGEQGFLKIGQRVLDELLMNQASWQPPFIAIHGLGGFGVMNADGEWNDSRQSLFAELIIKYGKELEMQEYVERGTAALKASFVMMYCPENPETKVQWEKVYPFFNEKDYGFMMENYGHGGVTNDEGLGIGEFTIYDWGNGAAAEAYNRILDHHDVKLP
ncbi:MAG TPA: hypothetical protein VG737_04110 [Cyclobacteriaceae bacterium]|nr:hypothetical protein [Cyclobacteriaceae bacterium]